MKQSNLFGSPVNVLTAIYFVVFGVLLVSMAHGDFVLWLNNQHAAFLDLFFKYWTYLGDGVMLGILGLFLLLTNYYRFIVFAVATALQTVFVHLFKQVLYAGEPRPKVFFEGQEVVLNFVEGVTVRGYDSFPSGHTAAGFVLCYLIMLWVENTTTRIVLFFTAVLIGLSRIYLLQHFLRDVYVGSLFGVLAVFLGVIITRRYESRDSLSRGLLKRS